MVIRGISGFERQRSSLRKQCQHVPEYNLHMYPHDTQVNAAGTAGPAHCHCHN